MKGKYGQRASGRREAAEVEASEAAYRRQIVRLTEERDQARSERDATRKGWRDEVRILRAQIQEGTSARTQALARELEKFRSRAEQATRELAEERKEIHRAYVRVGHYLSKQYGLSIDDAQNVATAVMFPGDSAVVPLGAVEERYASRYGLDGLEVLNRVTNRRATPRTRHLRTRESGLAEAVQIIKQMDDEDEA